MFEIFIALFGGAYYAGKIGSERAAHKAAVREREQMLQKWDEWDAKHTDLELEKQLSAFAADPNNYAAVWEEMCRAFDEMEHWRGITRQELEKLGLFYEARDNILLANRGKVVYLSSSSGYDAVSFDKKKRFMYFELAEWIMKTLRKQGIWVTLLYHKDNITENYVWEGSSAGTVFGPESAKEFSKFDRSLIEDKPCDIPKPYYETDGEGTGFAENKVAVAEDGWLGRIPANEFQDRVTNHKLENILQKFIADPSNYEAVRAEVYDVVKDWPAEKQIPAGQWSQEEALYIMMVKRGSVPYMDTTKPPMDNSERTIMKLQWGCAELNKRCFRNKVSLKVEKTERTHFYSYEFYEEPLSEAGNK